MISRLACAALRIRLTQLAADLAVGILVSVPAAADYVVSVVRRLYRCVPDLENVCCPTSRQPLQRRARGSKGDEHERDERGESLNDRRPDHPAVGRDENEGGGEHAGTGE